jgi:hypothetical protein
MMDANLFGLPVTVACVSRMMICDNEAGAKTNHTQADNGDWVCAVCGYNASAALRSDEHLADAMGKFVGLLSVANMDGARTRWLEMLVGLIAEHLGESALRDLVNIVGRRSL